MASVLYYACALPPPVHGQALVSHDLLCELQRSGANVIVADLSPGSLRRSFRYHIARIWGVSIAVGGIVFRLNDKVSLYAAVESGTGIIYNYALVLAARSRGGTIFLHHHTAPHTKMWKARFALLTYLAGPRTCHIATSNQMATNLRRHYKAVQNVLVSHPSCIIADARGPFSRRCGDLWKIGYLGNLCLDKGIDIAVGAVQFVLNGGIQAEFHVAGPVLGEQAHAIFGEAKQKFGERLVYWGPLYSQSKAQFFRTIDIFIFPSRYRNETQGLVNLEAMSSSKPVIALDIGYIAELLGYGGITVSIEDSFARALLEKMREWEADPARYEVEARRARSRFEELRTEAGTQRATLVNHLLSVCSMNGLG